MILADLHHCVRRNPTRWFKRKNGRLVWIDNVEDQGSAYLTGLHVVSETNGDIVPEYEWSHKSLVNAYNALCRHLGCQTRPDPEHIRAFTTMAHSYFTSWR